MNAKPLGNSAYAILLALSGGERHGYEILRQIGEDSGGKLTIGPATLYTNLKRLLESGLVEEVGRKSDDPHAEQRRYYALSATGIASLQSELSRMQRFQAIGGRRMA